MRKNLVFGFGSSGQSSAALLLKTGEEVFLKDDHLGHDTLFTRGQALIAQGAKLYEGEKVDRLILSPGIPLDHQFVQKMKREGVEIIGEIELALSFLENPEIIGITGTNGKTTTTYLVHHILKEAGISSKAVGNCGYSLSQYALNPSKEDVLVLELSSYQLETLYSKKLSNAVLLNITPDHLDRYVTMENYAKAKFAIHNGLKKGGKLFLQAQAARDWQQLREEKNEVLFGLEKDAEWTIRTEGESRCIYEGDELRLKIKDPHFPINMADQENALSAYLLLQPYGISEKDFLRGLSTFVKPSHRMEFVASFSGVDFIDDSKATNIDAVIKAVESLQKPINLIAGGVEKGFPYHCWIEPMAGKVRKIFVIGEAALNIMRDLGSAIEVIHCINLSEAVIRAFDCSQKGDCVLLSPGCASLDMFRDYAHRGEEFQKIAMQLQKEGPREIYHD